MKKIYSLSLLLFTAGTIFSAPLSGTYTIGGTAPNYTTFTAAVSALVTNGVSGAVVFDVRTGTYTEQITIAAVTGTSVTNTVTFQSSTGVNTDVTLTYGSGNNWVVNFNGCSYVTFKNMTLQSTGTSSSDVAIMTNSATYNYLVGLIITGPVTTTASSSQSLVDFCEDGTCTQSCGVYGCTLNNGSYGVYNTFSYQTYCSGGYYGSGSQYVSYNYAMKVENDSFVNQYAGAIYEVRCLVGASIEFNTIITNSTDTSYIGIKTSIQEDTICCNKIIGCPGTGINFENCDPFVFNNFVEITGSATNYGIEFTWDNYCAEYVFISANTVLVENTNSQSAAFYMPWPGYAWNFPFNNFSDNALINRGGGYAVYIQDNGSLVSNNYGQTITMDYNDYYTTGTYIGHYGSSASGGTDVTTLANWQSAYSGCNCGGDAHSQNINPSFVSNTDLHLTTDDLRYGTPAPNNAWWSTDIDGQARNATTPDIGADEYSVGAAVALFTANNTSVCVGSQVAFTDQSSGSPTAWKWTFTGGTPGNSTSQNPTINYDTAGTYNVKLVITTALGSDSITKTGYITVNPLPTPGTITATADSVCSGGSTQLTVTGSTGNIQWQSATSPGAFSNINGATNATYTTPSLSQNTTYRVVVNNNNCTDTSTAFTVTVNPLPPAPVISTNDSAICSYDSTEITVSGTYSSYQWNNGDTRSYTFAKTAGPYWVTVTDAHGCTAVSGQQNITAFPVTQPPVLSTTDSLICSSDSTSITASGSYFSYHWNTGDTTNYTYAKAAGPYWVTVTDANGCTAVSGQQNIGVFPVPSVSIDVNGDTMSSFNYSAYKWYFNDSVIVGATSNVYVAPKTGNYEVQVTDTNGCSARSNEIYIDVTGIKELPSNNNIEIYPNPASTEVFVMVKKDMQLSQIRITDMLGREVKRTNINTIGNNSIRINVADLPSGTYSLLFYNTVQLVAQKLLIK